MANYDAVDLSWTWDGDYIVGGDGDISDTASDFLISLQNEIHTVVRSEFGDWQKHPMLGCNISEFRGEPNTRYIADAMKARIISRLVASGIVKQEDLSVSIFPVGIHQVQVILSINTTPTVNNNIEPGESAVVTLTYDSLEDSVFFLPVNRTERDYYGTGGR